MDARQLIEDLIVKVSPNASIAGIEEGPSQYRITITGTTGVVADCEVPRAAVEDATRRDVARRRLAAALKECADHVVAPMPDGRG